MGSRLGGALAAAAWAAGLGGGPVWAASTTYAIDPQASRIVVHVGKSGVFGFLGHEHEVAGRPAEGRVVADPEALSASSVTLRFDAASLQVVAAKEPGGDAPKVQRTMEQEVLETSRHPAITFESSAVKGSVAGPGRYRLEVTGTLTLHGVSRRTTVPVDVEIRGDTLTATGRARVTHKQFGLRRVSAGGGTVKVADALAIDFTLVARAVANPG